MLRPGPHTLDEADAALAQWRTRLAAASRNVVELSELPAFLALKSRPATGRTAIETRELVATMDELWQGVLLIGAAIDRAAAARASGSRLWRGEEAAGAALAILEGESVEVPVSTLPVLNRGLLASARATVQVTPQRMLEAMEQAFERAKTAIDSLAGVRAACDAARAELAAQLARLAAEGWAGAAEAQAKLDAIPADSDPLTVRAQIEALRPAIAAALARRTAADQTLDRARADLAAIAALRRKLDAAEATCRAATDAALPSPDREEALELAGWLDRLARTLQAGQFDAFAIGLTRWRDLADKIRRECEAALRASVAALDRRDELRGRFGALRAKQAARAAHSALPDPAADEVARQLQEALFGGTTRLREAEHLMSQYEAALARLTPARSTSG